VWWVRAEQESVMLSDLAMLGQRLGLVATGNIEADARAALENIASRTEPWLMVYDNAPNADAVAKWLPVGSVRCLITSRFAAFDGVATVTRLDQWSDEVTADYLLARTGRNDKEGASRLAHSLGGLPLAAEQAAVFLKDRKGIGFDDYANEIARLIKEEKPAGAKGDYPDTVYAAFVKSLETLDGMKGGKTALNLLRLCAFLSPDGVDLALVSVNWGKKHLPADFDAAMADNFARENALAALASLSLLRREDRPAGPVLIFHRLLLEVTRDWMRPVARKLWNSAAVQLVDGAFPQDPDSIPSHWPLCSRLMLHVAPLEAHTPHTGEAGKRLDRLLNQACIYLSARGDRTGCLLMGEKSLSIARLTRSEEPLVLAARLNNLGAGYADLGRFDEAEAAYREGLALEESRLDPKDPSLAISFSNLAEVHYRRKQFAAAEPLCVRAAEVMKAAYGPNSAEYAQALSILGVLNSEWANEPGHATRRAQAEEYITLALAISRAILGTRHPAVATRHHNLAALRSDTGDWATAAAEEERATAISLSLDLAQHPHTHERIADLATFWQQSGQTDKARRLRAGDISDLIPAIALIEAEHRTWVAEDPRDRNFGPPSPFGAV
jgi:tetratricopeptide (TPR) repeat protein